MFLGIWFVNTWVNSVYFIRIIYRFSNVMTRYINMYVRDVKFIIYAYVRIIWEMYVKLQSYLT